MRYMYRRALPSRSLSERSGQELTLFIKHGALHQRLTNPLNHPAMHIATRHSDVRARSRTGIDDQAPGPDGSGDAIAAHWFSAAQNEANPALRNAIMGLPDWRQIRFTSSIAE